MYRIAVLKKAERQLKKLQKRNPQTAETVRHAISMLRAWPDVRAKRLINHTYQYRLRVGDYRVLFDVENEVKIIEI